MRVQWLSVVPFLPVTLLMVVLDFHFMFALSNIYFSFIRVLVATWRTLFPVTLDQTNGCCFCGFGSGGEGPQTKTEVL